MPSFWMERDDMIMYGVVLHEKKEVLSILQSCYKEGLIDPEFPVSANKQLNEKIVNSKIGLANATAWNINPDNAVHAGLRELTPGAELVMLEPPSGPKGKGYPEQSPGSSGMKAI